MNMNYYPEFEATWLLPLRLVFESIQSDPLWLERADCPYDKETVEALRGLWVTFRTKSATTVAPSAKSDLANAEDKWGQLSFELMTLFDELKNFSGGITTEDGQLDTKDQMAYFRTATSLLDKITGLAERIHNVKAVSDFRGRVLSVFDEVLTPEQRTIAMEKLAQ